MSAEIWRPIPSLPGYEASSLGRIKSRRPWRGTTERVLAPATNKVSGYRQVAVPRPLGGFVTVTVHSLVMAAFAGTTPPGLEIRHLDGDPSNNELSNLAYGTHAENCQDQFRHGTHPMASRTHCKHGHEFTPENTAIWKSHGRPFRQCVTCSRARKLAAKERAA